MMIKVRLRGVAITPRKWNFSNKTIDGRPSSIVSPCEFNCHSYKLVVLLSSISCVGVKVFLIWFFLTIYSACNIVFAIVNHSDVFDGQWRAHSLACTWNYLPEYPLKGKFSSGIEGALASTLNHNFNWKQLSEMILCIFLLMFSKFIWVTLIQKQQKYK